MHAVRDGRSSVRRPKNHQDAFYHPASFEIDAFVPHRELAELAYDVLVDLQEAGFTPSQLEDIGRALTALARSTRAGPN